MKRKLWLYLTLLTVLLAVGTALLLGIAQSGAGTQPIYKSLPKPGGAQTAQQAYVALESWAKTWSADAQVIAVSASLLKSEGQGQWWSFQLYSPSKRRVAMVLVQPSKIWMLREQTISYPQKDIPSQQWVLDSDAFLSKWWEERGSVIWQQSRAQSMHVHLGLQKNGVLVWQLSLMDMKGDLIDYWMIKADDGEVLSLSLIHI